MSLPEKQQSTLMQMISAKTSNRQLVQEFGTLTTQKIIERQYPAIGQLQLEWHPEKVQKAIAILLIDASQYFEETLPGERALDIATEITATYYNLSMEDVYLVIRKLKHQKHYGKLTANKILAAVSEYFDRRLEIAGEMSLNKHLSTKTPRRNEADPRVPYKQAMHQYNLQKLKTQTNEPRKRKKD